MTDKSLNCLYYLHPQIKDTVDENNELLEEKKELIIQLIKVKKELSEQKNENQEQYKELELLKKKYNMAKSVIKNLRNK